jgi:hypothetical protein
LVEVRVSTVDKTFLEFSGGEDQQETLNHKVE